MAPRGVAPRDGQEAGQAGLGGQQVVAGAVEPALRQVAADREEVAVRLVEEPEVHRRGQSARPGRPSRAQPVTQVGRRPAAIARGRVAGRLAATPRSRQRSLDRARLDGQLDGLGGGRSPTRQAASTASEPASRGPLRPPLARSAAARGQRGELGPPLADLAASRRPTSRSGSAARPTPAGPDAADQRDRPRVRAASSQLVPAEQVAPAASSSKPARAAGGLPSPPTVARRLEPTACRPARRPPRGPRTGSPRLLRSPCLSATRQPSRLPLSTVEM